MVNKAKKVTKSFKTYVISFAVIKHVVDGQKLEFLTVRFNSSELLHLYFIKNAIEGQQAKVTAALFFPPLTFFPVS